MKRYTVKSERMMMKSGWIMGRAMPSQSCQVSQGEKQAVYLVLLLVSTGIVDQVMHSITYILKYLGPTCPGAYFTYLGR